MEPEDVVHVLRRFRDVLAPRGLILDLQVIRPNPVVEAAGEDVCGKRAVQRGRENAPSAPGRFFQRCSSPR
jgi:hypothetical protein